MSEPCPTCGHVDATVTFTEGQSELSKSITAHRPISEVTGRGRTVRRDFTLAEIEAVLVEFRAAGAWDEATVALRYDELTCEVILHPIELPRALPEPRLPDRGRGKPARRCVLAGCPEGGIVLDPFSGVGTTGMVATRNGRRYIGVDNNADTLALSLETRLAQGALIEGAS